MTLEIFNLNRLADIIIFLRQKHERTKIETAGTHDLPTLSNTFSSLAPPQLKSDSRAPRTNFLRFDPRRLLGG